MRIKTEELFRQTESLRRRVEELETGNNLLTKALLRSNDEIQRLAARVKALEDELSAIEFVEEQGLRAWIDPGSGQVQNTVFEKDGENDND
jgi:predicted nuclease with TOPRIM domain